jgi:uncharacterized membrane protein YcaP (DUF421 family)
MKIKENLSKVSFKPLVLLTIFDIILGVIFGILVGILYVARHPHVTSNELIMLSTNLNSLLSWSTIVIGGLSSFLAAFILSRVVKKNFVHNCIAFATLGTIVGIVLMAGSEFTLWYIIVSYATWLPLVVLGSYLGYWSHIKKR